MDSGMSKLQAHRQQHHAYEKQYHAFQHEFIKAVQSLEAAEREIVALEKVLNGEIISYSHISPEHSPQSSSSRSLASFNSASDASDDTHFSIVPW